MPDGGQGAVQPDVRPVRNSTLALWYGEKRLVGLTQFAISITILNLAGHLFLGFEQSFATPLVAVATTYATELAGETADAWAARRAPRYLGGVRRLFVFLLPAHISGLAVGMLLYAGSNLYPIAFASCLAIASKYVFRIEKAGPGAKAPAWRHWMNPSNFGIVATLLLFPRVGIAPPYQFTENTSGLVDWLLPLVVIAGGCTLNIRATGRVPMILAWIAAFALQAIARAMIHQGPINPGLEPMTGFAFILFTFYMITDPGTTPSSRRGQVIFAAAVAATYALLMEAHVVFGLFFALAIVTTARGLLLYAASLRQRLMQAPARNASGPMAVAPSPGGP